MPATIANAEQRVLLHDVSWETYIRLNSENDHRPGTRFTFDNGELEIMTVYVEHENANRTLAQLVDIVAEETGKDMLRAGSTTFRRQDLLKGFEPDSCFYIEHARRVRGKKELELPADPPPDLVIEVDITRSSLNRFPIFAAVGVPEVWRYDGERVTFYILSGKTYAEIGAGNVLPPLTARQTTAFVKDSLRLDSRVWLRGVREWIRTAVSA